MKHKLWIFFLGLFLTSCNLADKQQEEAIFHGDLSHWKILENHQAFKTSDGALKCQGPDALIVYAGEDGKASYRNFELKAEAKTQPGANAAMLFHVNPEGEDVPGSGYAVQFKNTYKGMKGYPHINMTGSLNRIRNVYFPLVEDEEWFELRVHVQENHIQVYVNGNQTVDYVEPDDPWRPEDIRGRILSRGTIGIQTQNDHSGLSIRNIRVRSLADTAKSPLHIDKQWNRRVTRLHARNFPLIDFHIHLKGGLTLEEALDSSRCYGINYGIAANCGLKFPITNDKQLLEYIQSLKDKPVYTAMQAEGREWVDLFSSDVVAQADYVFTDAMTWSNDQGQRMRLWIPEETHVSDPQHFMDQLVSKIEGITREPIDIYVNPTFLPEKIRDRYDDLWTEQRISRVVDVLARQQIALEINDRYELPRKQILKKAKAAGVSFAFGTNNTGAHIGKLDYCLRMIEYLDLKPTDMWLPPQ